MTFRITITATKVTFPSRRTTSNAKSSVEGAAAHSKTTSGPALSVAEIIVLVTNLNGGYSNEFSVYYSIGQITENFESGFNKGKIEF